MQTTFASTPVKVISFHDFAEVRENTNTNQKSLHALISFKAGDIISKFTAGEITNTPHYLTVQTAKEQHITLVPQFLQYINHSCDPTVFFDTTSMQVIALKDISASEEFTFFYPSTEWDMNQPFYCYCESKNCLQNIRGAKYLTADQIRHYKLTDFIIKELQHTNL